MDQSTGIVVAAPAAAVPAARGLDDTALVDAFLSGRSPGTLRAYEGDLRDFGKFLGGMGSAAAVGFLLSLPGGPANEVVLRYRSHLIGRGLAAATIARRLAALRSVVKMARMLGRCSFAIEIEDPKVQKYRDVRGPGLEGWHAMKVTAEAMAEGCMPHRNVHPNQGVRDLALVHLIRTLALRRASAIGLDYEDLELDAERPAVWVHEKGKGQKVLKTLSRGVVASLRAWIAVRGDHPGPLFHRLDKGAGDGPITRLTGNAVYRLVRALGHRAGLTKRVRPHGLRHEAITAAARKGWREDQIREFAGHSDPKTTARYIEADKDAAGKIAQSIDE